MEFTAKQIAEFINGRIEGDENAAINTFAKIEEGTKGAISFLSNPKYTHYLYDTESSVVLVNEDVVLERPVKATLIRVKNAYESVAQLLQLYESMKPKKTGVSPLASIASSAKVGRTAISLRLPVSARMLWWATAARFILMSPSATVQRWATTVCSIPT